MKKELRLVKTSVGLVSEYALYCLGDRAIEIALEAEITYEEALTVLLKLSSKAIDGWYKVGDERYFNFNYNYDYFTVFKWATGTDILIVYNDNTIVYNLKNKKYYRELRKNDEVIKEEIEI